MTSSKAAALRGRESLEDDIARMRSGGVRDRAYYRTHIVEYFRDVLRVDLTPPQQVAARKMQRAMQRGGRFAAKSGRRTGKSKLLAGGALWAYDCWNARVIITAPTARQVDAILWREITMTRAKAARPIPGEIGLLARTGLRDGTGREIVGFTAREAEAMQGLAASADHPIVFIIDEASGVEQPIFDAIEGNRAGGGVLWMGGNPTKTHGEFFDAFHSKKCDDEDPESTGYDTCTLSTEEAATYGKPGLATPDYVAERAKEWGVDSALYVIHVKGEFAIAEEGRIFSLDLIEESVKRWHEAAKHWDQVATSGRLWLGIDPAGSSGLGDDSCFAARRASTFMELYERKGLTLGAHVREALDLMKRLRTHPNEQPIVVIDGLGPIGFELGGRLRAYINEVESKTHAPPFVLVEVRSSNKGVRGGAYDTQRDELAASLEAWVRAGGALPPDVKLQAELHALEWHQHASGAVKLTPKDDLRKLLGRSPNLYDAAALACWEPLHLRALVHGTDSASIARLVDQARAHDYDEDENIGPASSYGGGRSWDED